MKSNESMIKVVAGDSERVTSSNETLAFAASIYGAVCRNQYMVHQYINLLLLKN